MRNYNEPIKTKNQIVALIGLVAAVAVVIFSKSFLAGLGTLLLVTMFADGVYQRVTEFKDEMSRVKKYRDIADTLATPGFPEFAQARGQLDATSIEAAFAEWRHRPIPVA
jgi:hypothetical protein